MTWIDGATTAPRGFRAAGVRCGIKTKGPDLALLASMTEAVSCALFTTNAVKAAPVLVSMEHAASRQVRGFVANSGCANCATGERGLQDAYEMARLAAEGLGIPEDQWLVGSTGVIGTFLPMEKVRAGIDEAVESLSPEGGPDAARAIMTTDTRDKQVALEVEIGGRTVRIGGMAKGVGMIQPNVATMFAIMTTDAPLDPEALERCLRAAANRSFNCLTVDGDMSTNDTVALFANGAAGGDPLESHPDHLARFQAALEAVCVDLARQVARDGEGATKLVEVRVSGARTESDARALALAIANSNLVKTAFFGNDPNWGRILMAAGNPGIPLDLNRLRVTLAGHPVFEYGRPAGHDEAAVSRAMETEELLVTFEMQDGDAGVSAYTCDFSYDYVKINAEYRT
ncbi:MAG: bifunctional glutamate N-acetyltransferase/amino-acid acetyltransferase ArgJ [Armatimonadetes bacterium]|nr:bifunctional glutamate N-acetyltransferase/amino-acid acetyltransferase ArgJ [Armatimonadota bacterium]